MDFAKKQLEKYGWKEGQGLGKNEDGIAKAIKPKLKFDNTGVGHDYGEQFNNKWWEKLFNNASKNIDVQIKGESVNLSLKSEPIDLTTKSYSIKKKDKSNLYGSFLKTQKLTSKGIEDYDVPKSRENPKKYTELTDEELFAACGGRTAHKGARHGLKLSGKLSRIDKQEKLLLKKMKGGNTDDESTIIKKMKKLNIEKEKLEKEDTNDSIETISNSSGSSTKIKKKKSKKNVSFNEIIVQIKIPSNETVEPVSPTNSDEGIDPDMEDTNNNEDDNHQSFEVPQCLVSDLSNAERKKLKKKRKLKGENRATMKFIKSIDQTMDDEQATTSQQVDKNKCLCKKRKLNTLVDVKCSDSKRSQCNESPVNLTKKKKKKKDKKMKKLEKYMKSDEKKMKNIVRSMDNYCKITDDN